MVSVLATNGIDRGYEPWSGQTKDYEICICCFSAKYAALKSKNKDRLTQNQNEVSEWSNVYIPADKDWLALNQNEVSEWSNVYIPADKDWLAQNQNEVSEWSNVYIPADCCFIALAL